MTPEDKAQELVNKYIEIEYLKDFQGMYFPLAKQCSLIAVDEIIQAMDSVMFPNPFKQYWNKVKQEIEKL